MEPTIRQSHAEFPVYAIVIIALVLSVMTTAVLCFLCRCWIRRKKREHQLYKLTPRIADPRLAGVWASQPIEFVVPSTVTVSENTTEDSVSEAEYLPDRRRKRFGIHPEELQRGLYEGLEPPLTKPVQIGFSLHYSLPRHRLTMRLIATRDLPIAYRNPCVKVVLLPDKNAKCASRFDACLVFCVHREQLPEKRLKISVWDRKRLVGQVLYNVRDSGLTNSLSLEAITGEIWIQLKQESLAGDAALISLSYDPDSAILNVALLKLRTTRNTGTDIYAKVSLYVNRRLIRRKKTPSRKKAQEVHFAIRVPREALGEVDLLVAVCEKPPKRVLGMVQAGPHCSSEQGQRHWRDMLDSPKSTCTQWYALQ